MSRQIETGKSEWARPTRAQQLEEKISELERIRSLIPTVEDLLKYSLTANEVFRVFPNFHNPKDLDRLNRWRDAMNGVMVILRKRDAENPEIRISWYELREAVNILVDEEPHGDTALFVINLLERQGFIDTDNWRYVNVVKPMTEIEGGVPVPF